MAEQQAGGAQTRGGGAQTKARGMQIRTRGCTERTRVAHTVAKGAQTRAREVHTGEQTKAKGAQIRARGADKGHGGDRNKGQGPGVQTGARGGTGQGTETRAREAHTGARGIYQTGVSLVHSMRERSRRKGTAVVENDGAQHRRVTQESGRTPPGHGNGTHKDKQ